LDDLDREDVFILGALAVVAVIIAVCYLGGATGGSGSAPSARVASQAASGSYGGDGTSPRFDSEPWSGNPSDPGKLETSVPVPSISVPSLSSDH
jgi:hypothetical protein